MIDPQLRLEAENWIYRNNYTIQYVAKDSLKELLIMVYAEGKKAGVEETKLSYSDEEIDKLVQDRIDEDDLIPLDSILP